MWALLSEEELPELISDVDGIQVIVPERTFLEKLLILHGVYCGYRDESRLPADRHRISRHYYDVAMIEGLPKNRSTEEAISDRLRARKEGVG